MKGSAPGHEALGGDLALLVPVVRGHAVRDRLLEDRAREAAGHVRRADVIEHRTAEPAGHVQHVAGASDVVELDLRLVLLFVVERGGAVPHLRQAPEVRDMPTAVGQRDIAGGGAASALDLGEQVEAVVAHRRLPQPCRSWHEARDCCTTKTRRCSTIT